MTSWEIQPNRGIGQIRFGATRSDVQAILGNPAPVADRLGKIEAYVTRWEYTNPDLALTFRVPTDSRFPASTEQVLHLISTTSRDMKLFGSPVIGKSEESVKSLMEEHLHEACVKTHHPVLGTYLEFTSSNMKMHLSDGIVTHIQWKKAASKYSE